MFAENVIALRRSSPGRRSWMDRAVAAAGAMRHTFAEAVRVAATRRYLTGMDDRMLSDIGISRAQAQFEAGRPVWSMLESRRY